MKPWLICVTALVAGTAFSQTKKSLPQLDPGDSLFTREMRMARDAKRKEYFSFTMTSGVYPLIGITNQPVAKFQYQYAGGQMLNYQNEMNTGSSGTSMAGYNFGFEWGKKKGVFYNFAVGGLIGMSSSRVSTKYFTSSVGYNIRTGIPGLTLQPSMGFAKTTVVSHMSDIPQDQKDIHAFNTTFRYKDACGCIAYSTKVSALNSTSFAQTKLAIKYNINRVISVTAGATYFVPLRTSYRIELRSKNDFERRSGYVSASSSAMQSDSQRDSAVPFYGEITIAFNLAITPKIKRAYKPSSSGTYHHHSSSFHGGGGHSCH